MNPIKLVPALLLICMLLMAQNIFAQDVAVKRSTVIEMYKGKPYYIHFINSGETLTAISKVYNVSIEEITAENPSLANGLKADMVIRIPQKPVAVNQQPATTEPKPVSDNTVKPVVSNSQKASDSDFHYYTVKKQETLYGISKQYDVSVEDIINANPGFDGLKDGMELRIPKHKGAAKPVVKTNENQIAVGADPDKVIVKTGETLYSIAKANNTTVDKLIELNPQVAGGLKAGMVLNLKAPKANESITANTEIITVTRVDTVSVSDCYDPENARKTYKVTMLLPFLLENASAALEATAQSATSEFDNFNYFQFYAGFMMAADSLKHYGLNAQIQVLDADKYNDTLVIRQALRKPGLDKSDLIIGPMYAASFSIASRFAKKNKIGIVNPLSKRENIIEGNPYVIKTQVSAEGISSKLISLISAYPGANVVVVRNDKKEMKELADNFTAMWKAGLAASSLSGTIQEAVFTTEQMAGVAKKLKNGVQNFVIFFSTNKTSVPNFVSLLNPHSKTKDLILVGMDGWEEMDLETEFLVNLNYHQVSSSYIDYESEAVTEFISRFKTKYGAMPLSTQHAFLGFDIGWYFLTSLMWYGDDYLECLSANKGKGLQYNFSFPASKSNDGVQNQDVSILKLDEYKMVKVK